MESPTTLDKLREYTTILLCEGSLLMLDYRQLHERGEIRPRKDLLWRLLHSRYVVVTIVQHIVNKTVNVLTGHAATISTLSYAIRFWSKGTKKAMFLRHEGFL